MNNINILYFEQYFHLLKAKECEVIQNGCLNL